MSKESADVKKEKAPWEQEWVGLEIQLSHV